MLTRSSHRFAKVATAVLAATMAAGIPYWTIPYNRLMMTGGGFLMVWGIAALVAGAVIAGWLAIRPLRAALVVCAGFALAVMGRVVIEGLEDPTSHNLWPFEVVIAVVAAVPFGTIGGILGGFVRRRRA